MFIMKSIYIVFSAVLALASGGASPPPYLGKPCHPSDTDCCGDKLKTLGGLLLQGLENPLIGRLDIDFDYGCCDLRATAQNTSIVGLANIGLDDFKIDLNQKTVELDLAAAELNISATYDITGKCVDLPVSAGGETLLRLKNLKLKLIVQFDIQGIGFQIVDLKIKPTIGGISFLLSNPSNNKLQKLLNQNSLDKTLTIFQSVFQKLICNLESILLQLLASIFNDLNIALFLLL